jgi:sulfate transport system substrate-binding protein
LIENPVAVTTATAHRVQARAFVDFLWTPTAQRLFGEKGYRPVLASVAKGFSYRTPPGLFRITGLGLGGWTSVTTKFFDPQNGIMAQIERERGVGVGSG